MNITLNGLNNPSNIITLSDCPTILTVESYSGGNKAMLTIEVNNLMSITEGVNLYITINGEKITSTFNLNQAINRNFYITSTNVLPNKIFIAQSIVNALRSCPQLDANYDIYQAIQSSSSLSPVVYVVAKESGYKYNITYETNSVNVFNFTNTAGTSTDELAYNIKTTISVDIYKITGNLQPRIGSNLHPKNEYVTTLKKQYYRDETHFDLSPVLSVIAEPNQTVAFLLYVYATVDNRMITLGQIGYNYVAEGYSVNQGGTYIPNFSNVKLAQNVSRGTVRNVINHTILYTYEPSITLSLFSQYTVNNLNISISYVDSQLNEISKQTKTVFITDNLSEINIGLNPVGFSQASYIDIGIPNLGTIRYNVIKPINATIDNYRIYYNNSYGGVSFFDFTGDRTETRKLSVDTYQKQLFNFYKNDIQELDKVYNKDVTITVSLKSHLIPKDAIWQFYDMQKSINAWTTVNGVKYAIIINDVTIDETTTEGIYEATIKYTYSLDDDFN